MVRAGQRGRDWDQQIEVMELPRAFRTTLTNVPAETPYLWIEPRYLAGSRRALGPWRKPRVGLLWEGGDWNPERNVPFAALRPLLDTHGVEFFSFQRGAGRERLASSRYAKHVRDLSGDSPNVAYFAADIVNMDLLITVDTMAAHLAGALAKPVWVLLPYEADWRWMLDRRDSPWYPTMRLFRQRIRHDWHWPVEQIGRELAAWLPSASLRYNSI